MNSYPSRRGLLGRQWESDDADDDFGLTRWASSTGLPRPAAHEMYYPSVNLRWCLREQYSGRISEQPPGSLAISQPGNPDTTPMAWSRFEYFDYFFCFVFPIE